MRWVLVWLLLAAPAWAQKFSGEVEFITNPPGLDAYLDRGDTVDQLVRSGNFHTLTEAGPLVRVSFGYGGHISDQPINVNTAQATKEQRWPVSGTPIPVTLPWAGRLRYHFDHGGWMAVSAVLAASAALVWRRRRKPRVVVVVSAPQTSVPGYVIEGPLGEGGMGEVFRGRSQETGQEVAIKILRSGLSDMDESRKRFDREIRALKGLRHPNIVPVLDWGETHDGRPYLVMELLQGHTLAEELAERTPDSARSLYILQQIGLALEVLHQKDLVHRDIKPDNLFVLEAGRIVLMDFGAVRGGNFTVHTEEGHGIGTPSYMAPEQIGGQAVAASDQYSLGVLAFRLFTGRRPFEQADLVPLLHAHLQLPPPDPREIRPDLPAALAHTILRMLEKEPHRRYPSLNEAVQALTRSLGGEEATLV